ncbi:hypothetical protein [Burkholderia ubonensis]|uniref:hypothetical protein n=1 Tax=Burkholderia ubonensis TaxID=101571 RepID=UPI000A8F5F32|nr:hypothetical protein [Burkholderia ubonensis]
MAQPNKVKANKMPNHRRRIVKNPAKYATKAFNRIRQHELRRNSVEAETLLHGINQNIKPQNQ